MVGDNISKCSIHYKGLLLNSGYYGFRKEYCRRKRPVQNGVWKEPQTKFCSFHSYRKQTQQNVHSVNRTDRSQN